MIKSLFLFSILFSSTVFSQDFSGCGEYSFKGVLRHNNHAPFKMIYVVNERTKSQMTFNLLEMDDVKKLALMINLPTKIKGNIVRRMDGTKGVLTFPSEIKRDFPDPLSSKESGINKIKNFKCN